MAMPFLFPQFQRPSIHVIPSVWQAEKSISFILLLHGTQDQVCGSGLFFLVGGYWSEMNKAPFLILIPGPAGLLPGINPA